MALVAIVVRFRAQLAAFDWPGFLATFSRLDWLWMGAACLAGYGTYICRTLRWGVFLEPLRQQPNLGAILKATIIGFTAVNLFGRPGEIVRPYLIAVREEVSLSSQLAIWVMERLFDLVFALSVFGYGLSRVTSSQVNVGPALEWAFQAGGAVVLIVPSICLILLIFLRSRPEVFIQRLTGSLGFLPDHHQARIEKFLRSFLQGVESLRSNRSLFLVVAYSLLNWMLIAACYFCIMKAFQDFFRFNLVDVLIFMGFVSFGAVVQLPGIGGGMQVVAVLVLHEIFRVPVAIAGSVALLTWLTTFVTIIPIGLPLALHEGINWRKIKSIQEEAPQ